VLHALTAIFIRAAQLFDERVRGRIELHAQLMPRIVGNFMQRRDDSPQPS
jgi:hypothetical protein